MSSGFVSEADLAERRRVRKEIWMSTKRDSDPEEPPEEAAPDNRSLYERLQEQKDKKQEEWEEAHKLKNMVRGLEDDEVDFLELVDNTKIQEEKRIKAEENSALQEYRKKVSEMQQKAIETEVLTELKPESKKQSSGTKRPSSQLSLLAGAIKRRKTETGTTTTEGNHTPASKNSGENKTESVSFSKAEAKPTVDCGPTAAQCVAILPGLGVYTDSSDSDDSNSDSDIEIPCKGRVSQDITGRIVHVHNATSSKG